MADRGSGPRYDACWQDRERKQHRTLNLGVPVSAENLLKNPCAELSSRVLLGPRGHHSLPLEVLPPLFAILAQEVPRWVHSGAVQ